MGKQTPPDSRPNGLDAELAEEMRLLERELCNGHRLACAEDGAEPVLGVFRLFSGVRLDDWSKFSENHQLTEWLTLPVGQDAVPHLRHQQELLAQLSYKTEHDPLTGLANRRAFERSLDLELERSRRNRTPVCLAMLDLDDFKGVNDTHGHHVGDVVLQRTAELLAGTTRRYDLAARYGGEEFALILSGIGLTRAEAMVERFLADLRALPFELPDGGSFHLTCSAGLACFKGTLDLTPEAFLKLADDALYRAKGAGKDRIVRAPLPDVQRVPKETLVHAGEKKLLFGK